MVLQNLLVEFVKQGIKLRVVNNWDSSWQVGDMGIATVNTALMKDSCVTIIQDSSVLRPEGQESFVDEGLAGGVSWVRRVVIEGGIIFIIRRITRRFLLLT